MAVVNGNLANQVTFNNAFLSRTTDTTAAGKIDLLNVNAESGSSINNIQREHNSAAAFMGKDVNAVASSIPGWVNNDVGASTDSLFTRSDNITVKFNETTGHNHNGDPGQGPKINAADLDNFNAFFSSLNNVFIFSSVGGASADDYTSSFNSKSPLGSDVSIGVITTGSRRVSAVRIRDSEGKPFIDEGKEIVGFWNIINLESDPELPPDFQWNLLYETYTSADGWESVELPSTSDVTLYFNEVFQGFRPTLDLVLDPFLFGGGGGGAGGGLFTINVFTGTTFTPTSAARQVWRYTGTSAQTITEVVEGPDFGEIEITSLSDTNTITLNPSATGIATMNGTWIGYRGSCIRFRFDSSLGGYMEVSRNGI